jgi:hypothetical protein
MGNKIKLKDIQVSEDPNGMTTINFSSRVPKGFKQRNKKPKPKKNKVVEGKTIN